jgi:hypothetical protein
VAMLSALRTGRLYPQEIFLALISVRLSRPQVYSAAGRNMSMKNFNDTIGNRSSTFRFVAQCLKHCATACPLNVKYPLLSSDFNEDWASSTYFLKNTLISNLMKIHQVGAELFHAGRRTERHEESDNRFSLFRKRLEIVSRHNYGRRGLEWVT